MRQAAVIGACVALLASACVSSGSSSDGEIGEAPPDARSPASFTPVAAYFVGSSLTWDTLGDRPMDYLGIDMLARQAGIEIAPNGYHIICGMSLLAIAQDPSATCIGGSEYGPLAEALPSDGREVLTVQPDPGFGSTLLSDEKVITQMVGRVRGGAGVFVLAAWPRLPIHRETRTSTVEDSDETASVLARDYFEHLVDRLADAGVEAKIIPAGEALYRFDKHLSEGSVGGMTSIADLHRDEVHLSSAGQRVASVTAATAILAVDPHLFGKPIAPWFGAAASAPEFVALVQERVEDGVNGEASGSCHQGCREPLMARASLAFDPPAGDV